MDSDNCDELSFVNMWKEISRIEYDILKGKLSEEDNIVEIIREIFEIITAQKVVLKWPRKDEGPNGLGLKFGAIGPWPLVHRMKNLLNVSSGLWKNHLLLVYFKANLEYIYQRYHLALDLLIKNFPKKNSLVPGYYFSLTQENLFKSGQNKKAIELAQEELSKRGCNPPNYIEGKLPVKNEMNERLRRITRHTDRIYTGNFVDDHLEPYWYLMENLKDYAEYIFTTNLVQLSVPGIDLLQEAQINHGIYSLPTAATLYDAYIKTNEHDHEAQFLLGRVYLLLGKYQEAILSFTKLKTEDEFSSLSHFSLGEILFLQDAFSPAEAEFLAAIENSQEGMAQTLSRFHLGFIREIQGDFRAALAWYEPEQDGLFPDLAISHLDALRTRKD